MGKIGEGLVQVSSHPLAKEKIQRKSSSFCSLEIGISIEIIYLCVVYKHEEPYEVSVSLPVPSSGYGSVGRLG